MTRCTPLPSEEQRQRTKWDALLIDTGHRQEHAAGAAAREIKAYERRGIFPHSSLFTAGAAFAKFVLGLPEEPLR